MGANEGRDEADVSLVEGALTWSLIRGHSWPGYLDNSVAGGIPSGMGVLEALLKESWEEAGLDGQVVGQYARPAGVVSYLHRSPTGWLQPEIEYVYDMVVPPDVVTIVPRPLDGEVASFEVSK